MKPYEEFYKEFSLIESHKFINLDELTYKGVSKKITAYCTKHKYEFYPIPLDLINGHGCKYCALEKNTIQRGEKFVSEFRSSSLSDNISINISTFSGMANNISAKCLIHNHEFYPTPKSLLQGHGCPLCGYDRIAKNNSKSHQQYESEFINSGMSKEYCMIDKYIKRSIKTKFEHILCGHVFEVLPYDILCGHGCPVCNGNKVVIKGINDIHTTHPHIGELLANFEDGYKYRAYSSKKVNFICPDCKSILKNKTISNVTSQGLGCIYCSDGVSYPNKFMYSVLRQIGVVFTPEKILIKETKKKYDVYIEEHKILIEVHGDIHYTRGYKGNNVDDVLANDLFKYEQAINYGIKNYIIIDARHSEKEWIKNSIINSKLSDFYDFSFVDWDLCDKSARNSLVSLSASLWNGEIRNTKAIADKLQLSTSTIVRYLKIANNLGLCDYSTELSLSLKDTNACIKNLPDNRKKIICINTGEVFNSIVDASKHYGISDTYINNQLKGRNLGAGKLPNGEKLRWEYVS